MTTLNTIQEAQDFSIEDQSSSPYAWLFENVEVKDIAQMGIPQYIEAHVKQQIAAINFSEMSDNEVYTQWLETGEMGAARKYAFHLIVESLLEKIVVIEQEAQPIRR